MFVHIGNDDENLLVRLLSTQNDDVGRLCDFFVAVSVRLGDFSGNVENAAISCNAYIKFIEDLSGLERGDGRTALLQAKKSADFSIEVRRTSGAEDCKLNIMVADKAEQSSSCRAELKGSLALSFETLGAIVEDLKSLAGEIWPVGENPAIPD